MTPTHPRGNAALYALVGVVIVIIGAGIWYAASRPDTAMTDTEQGAMMENGNETDAMMEDIKADIMMEQEDSAMLEAENDAMMENGNAAMEAGAYVDYSPETYAAAADQKRILFFHASWCPTCTAANIEFNQNTAQIPDGVVVLKTNYDTQTELKNKYGITYQHTFVQVDAQGNEIAKWNGGGVSELAANIQ